MEVMKSVAFIMWIGYDNRLDHSTNKTSTKMEYSRVDFTANMHYPSGILYLCIYRELCQLCDAHAFKFHCSLNRFLPVMSPRH